MKSMLIAVLVMIGVCFPVLADVREGTDAYNKGDFVTAHREFLAAAEQGDVRAKYSLGLLYLRGQGVPADPLVAVRWLRQAAGWGDGDARLVLGSLYMRDLPKLKDYIKSYVWLTLALSKVRGSKRDTALRLRGEVRRKMTSKQITRGNELLEEWRALDK